MAEKRLTKKQVELLNTRPISSWEYPRVIVGIPLERALSHANETFWRFMEIASRNPVFGRLPYQRTDLYRNKMAELLLSTDFTHLIMLDIDHTHPVDIIQRLSRWVLMDDKIKIVGGLNFRRGEPFEPCAFNQDPDGTVYAPADWGQGLIKVDYIGTGSIMISREVFEEIEPPWFYNDYRYAYQGNYPGEDMGFCAKATEAGFNIWLDTTTTSPHLTTKAIDETTFREHMNTHRDKLVDVKTKELLTDEEIEKRKLVK